MKWIKDHLEHSAPGAGTSEISRRDFINGVLVAGASLSIAPYTSVFAAQESSSAGAPQNPAGRQGIDKTDDFSQCHKIWKGEFVGNSPTAGSLYDCIVVGGGMSGLVAAWQLKKLGIEDILILEKDAQAGGLCCSDTIDGVRASRASAYPSFPFNEDMIKLYSDLGFVRTDGEQKKVKVNNKYILKPPYDQLFMKGRWIEEPFASDGIQKLPVTQAVRDDLKKFIEVLADLYEWEDAEKRTLFDCPIDDSSPAQKIRNLDGMTLGAYVTSQGWSLEMIKLFDPLLKSAYGLGHERISTWAALDILKDELLPSDSGKESIGFPGGNAYFAEQLAKQIGADRIKTNTLVTQITEKNNEVQVGIVGNGIAQTLRARSVIFATSQFLAPYLLPALPADRRKAAQSYEYASYVVANIGVTRTPANLAYSNQLVGDFLMSDFIVADWTTHPHPTTAPLGRRNVLTAYCPMTANDREQLLSPSLQDWQNKILSEFELCLPGLSKTVTAFHLYRWGHSFAVPAKGKLFSAERLLTKKPFGRIFFAGADAEGVPTIDHAMASGFRSAREVEMLLD